jgi:hypothetical protein
MDYDIDLKRIKEDPVYFVEAVINLTEPKLILADFHKEWLRLPAGHKRLSLMAFRSSGKTELFFVVYPIWRAFTQPGFQGIVTSNTEKQAIRILRRIKQRIEANPILKTSIPSARTDTWSKTELTLSNGSWIGSKPYNENLRGEHIDFIGCDEMGEYKDFDILKKVVLPMLRAKRGNLVGVGTPTSDIDLLHTIEKEDFFRAFQTDRFPAEGDKGDLFKIRYPETEVKHTENVVELWDSGLLVDTFSNIDWSQEFLLVPLGEDDQLFPISLINYSFDRERRMELKTRNDCKYYMGLDFAMSSKTTSDYTVITIIERPVKGDEMRVIWIDRSKGLSYQAQKAKIINYARLVKPTKIVCDDGNVGKIFIQDLKAAYLPVEGYHFGGSHVIMGQNKRELFMLLREQFEKQKLYINADSSALQTRIMTNRLVEELTKFSNKFEGKGKHDDMVDSLALAVYGARRYAGGVFTAVAGGGRRIFAKSR